MRYLTQTSLSTKFGLKLDLVLQTIDCSHVLMRLDLSIDPIARFRLRVPLIGCEFLNFIFPRSLDYLDLSINHTRCSTLPFELDFPAKLSELRLTDEGFTATPKPIANLTSPKKAKTRQHRKPKKSKEKEVGIGPLPSPLKKPKAKWQRKATATFKSSAEVPIVTPAQLIHFHMVCRVPY